MTFGASIELTRGEQVPAVEGPGQLSHEQRMWLALIAGPAPTPNVLSPTP